MAYADGTFTSVKQNGPTRLSYPFLNYPTKDTTTKQYETSYAVLPASWTPLAALGTYPGDGTFAANTSAYLVDETQPEDAGGFYRVTRKWSMIPGTQTKYGSRLFVRPVMHDIKSGSQYAVSFDDGISSWRFSSRISVSSVGSIASYSKTVSGTNAGVKQGFSSDTMPGAAVFVTTDIGSSIVFFANSGAFSIKSTLAAISITAEVVSSYTGLSITVISTSTRRIASMEASTSELKIDGSGGSYTLSRIQTSAYNDVTETASITETYGVPTNVRTLSTGSSHSGSAGEWMAAWNGDKLIGFCKPTAASGTSITIPADESPFSVQNIAITHIAFAGQAAARYVNGPVSVTTKEETSFYLPTVSPGITTPADIALVAPKTDPVSWLGEIIAGTSFVVVDGSQLEVWQGPIYQQTTVSAQMSDALDTISVSA